MTMDAHFREAVLCCSLLLGGCSPGHLGGGPGAGDAAVTTPLSADAMTLDSRSSGPDQALREGDGNSLSDGQRVSTGGFGYPVGDRTSWPAGGWNVWQVLGHVNKSWSPPGHHLGQDLAHPDGGEATIDQPVSAVADGTVLYAKANGTTYKHVILIRHPLSDGSSVCSFYGHINQPTVHSGDAVTRGQQITTIADWATCLGGGPSSNTHLHYVLLNEPLCAYAAATGDGPYSSVCAYDHSTTELGHTCVDDEPQTFTAIADDCGNSTVSDGFLSPTQFIEAHRP